MYYQVLTFKTEEDYKKAREILKQEGIDVEVNTPLGAFCYAEAEYRLTEYMDYGYEEIIDENGNIVEPDEDMISELSDKLYNNDYVVDSETIDYTLREFLASKRMDTREIVVKEYVASKA